MDFAEYHKRPETDRVSSFIRALAIGLIVLGAAFGVLDRCHLLLQSPAATSANDPSS
jgi:hypothetical protein